MTADEANEVLRTAVWCLRNRRVPPYAWMVHHTGGRDVVAEAWWGATSAVAMMRVLDCLDEPGKPSWRVGWCGWDWNTTAAEAVDCLHEERHIVSLADILARCGVTA